MSGRTTAKTKRPSASAVTVCALPWVRLVSVTLAPGSTPPWGSFTEPDTDALVVCACSDVPPARQSAPTSATPTAARHFP